MPDTGLSSQLMFAALGGLVGGLVLLARGLLAYRDGTRIRSVATSRLDALAAGEVRVTGTVEPLALTLVSPFQSVPCVWYSASITAREDSEIEVTRDERSVSFLLRDDRGEVRVIPRIARWEVEPVFDESSGIDGEGPVGLRRNQGPSTRPAEPTTGDAARDAAIAELLTVRLPERRSDDAFDALGLVVAASGRRGGHRYREARIEPGRRITVLGQAIPYSDLDTDDPGSVFMAGPESDPALADDLAEARAAGILAPDAATAWGNAAIPGFGIGKPVTEPELDPDADHPVLASPDEATRAARIFDLPPETLVITSLPGNAMTVYDGTPAVAERAHDGDFLMGLAGAGLSVVCAAGLAIIFRGGL